MKVIVVPDVESGEDYVEANFIRVHSYPMPKNPWVRLAVVEHHYTSQVQLDASRPVRACMTLIDHERMSHENAMEMAIQYAIETDVRVIYERHEVAEADEYERLMAKSPEPQSRP